jgi:hypothetical protein
MAFLITVLANNLKAA